MVNKISNTNEDRFFFPLIVIGDFIIMYNSNKTKQNMTVSTILKQPEDFFFLVNFFHNPFEILYFSVQ